MNARVSVAEQLLGRVIAYLDGMDLVISRPLANRALVLVQEALAQQGEDPFVYVMAALPRHFALQEVALPPLAPPLQRGSLGYPR